MKVKEYRQTCWACPAQWEGFLQDGRMFYAKYRWGALTIEISDKPTTNLWDVFDHGKLIFEEYGDNDWDGFMTTETLIEKTNKILDFSEAIEKIV